MTSMNQEAGNGNLEVPIRKFLLLTSCFLLVFAVGCATSGDFEALKSNVASLQSETQIQQKEINQIKTSLPEISSDLSTLKEQGFTAIRESQASLVSQSSDLSKEIQLLKGRFDENKYFVEKNMKDLLSERELQQAKTTALENEINSLKAKINDLVAEQKEMAAAAEASKQPAAADTVQKPADNAQSNAEANNPQKLYDNAQVDFKEKSYADARQKLKDFIKDYPKHALVPNAYFWVGETYYAEKKYDDAILSYEDFLKKYPSHDKAKGAMLKQAYAFVEMGDKKTGKVILERLIEKYPQSAEADLAEKKIAEILSKNSGSGSSNTKKTRSKKKKR